MSSGNDFFKAAQGTLEQAMAFWPETQEKNARQSASELIQNAEQRFDVDLSARANCAGRVVSQNGCDIVVFLDSQKLKMDVSFALRKGDLLKIVTEQSVIYGTVTALSVPMPGQSEVYDEVELAELELFGEAVSVGDNAKFRKAIITAPALGDLVYQLTDDDWLFLKGRPKEDCLNLGRYTNDGDEYLQLSQAAIAQGQTLILGKDRQATLQLFNTINQEIRRVNSDIRIHIIDRSGEFGRLRPGGAELSKGFELALPFWKLVGDEIAALILGLPAHNEAFQISSLAIQYVLDSLPYNQEIHADVKAWFGEFIEALEALEDGRHLLIANRLQTLAGQSEFQFLFSETGDKTPFLGSAGALNVLDFSVFSPRVASVALAAMLRLCGADGLGLENIVAIDQFENFELDSAKSAAASLLLEQLSQIAGDNTSTGLVIAASSVSNRLFERAGMDFNHVMAFNGVSAGDGEWLSSALMPFTYSRELLMTLENGMAVVFGDEVSYPQRVIID